MTREAMLEAIEAIYRARIARDVGGMQALMAEGATFRFAGETTMQDAFAAQSAMPFAEAVRSLDGGIAMLGFENVTSVVEANRVAAIWNCTVQFPGREPFDTEISNIWTFDEAGKITSLTEFVDTAKLAQEMAEGVGV